MHANDYVNELKDNFDAHKQIHYKRTNETILTKLSSIRHIGRSGSHQRVNTLDGMEYATRDIIFQ